MKQSICWISLCLGVLPPAARAQANAAPPARAAVPTAATSTALPRDEYRLGPEDVLQIRVARHDELGAEVTVLNDGTVMLPRVGEVQVLGRTPREVQALIVAGLRKTLVDPQVSVVVRTPRPRRVFLSGSVRRPGAIVMQPGWRVTEAVAEAGGLLVKPERARATLFRRPNETIALDLGRIYLTQDVGANLVLEPGDNLDVQEEPTIRIYVSGAVSKAGPIELPKGSGLTEAIALAGGVTPLAGASRTVVQRLSGERVPVDMDRVLNHGEPAPAIALETGDQIVIPENRRRVAVLGYVKSPGPFPLHDGVPMTVAEAVSLAGGTIKRAATSRIGVIRMINGESQVIEVNLGRVLKKGSSAENPPLEDGDIVYVPETGKPDWSRILPGVQSIGSLWYFLTR